MKKLLTIAALASAAAVYADVDIDAGTVGVTKITTSAKNTVVVTSYNELDGSGAGAMAVSNIVKTANLTVGTKLYVLSSGSSYKGYTLKYVSGESGPKFWERDSNYTVDKNGNIGSGTTSDPTDLPTLTVGKGFWISLPEADAPSYSKEVVVYGKPPADTNVTITSAGTYLVGNPTQTTKPPTEIDGAQGDTIMVFSGTSQFPTTYVCDGNKNWTNNPLSATPGSLPVINAGTGFWYIHKTSSSVVIKWL